MGQAGGLVKVVAAKVGGVTGSDGAPIKADMQLAGAPSVLFDAVALLVSDAGGAALLREAAADGFVRNAYAHTAGTAGLLSQAGVPNGAGIVSLDAGTAGMFVRGAKQGRVWDREAKARAVF